MVVTATYNDESTEIISNYEVSISSEHLLTSEDISFTVTYEGKTAIQEISVLAAVVPDTNNVSSDITTALESINETLQSLISPSVIAIVVCVVLGSCVVLFITWFGIRKLISTIIRALKGRLSV